jgi:hypothetical protein
MQDGLFGAAEHLRRISQPKPASGHVGYDSPSNIVGDMNSPRRLRHDLPGLEESLASPPPHGVGADTELAGRQRDIHPAGIIGVDRRRDLRGRNPQSESQSCHPSCGERVALGGAETLAVQDEGDLSICTAVAAVAASLTPPR